MTRPSIYDWNQSIMMHGSRHVGTKQISKWHVFGVIHEAGHGMYEQDIDDKYAYTPVYQGTSMGIHESQSFLMKSLLEATAVSGKTVSILPRMCRRNI